MMVNEGDARTKGNKAESCQRTYQIAGNQVILLSRKSLPLNLPDQGKPGPSTITLLAVGDPLKEYIDDGKIDVRGVKGVRITSGPLLYPSGEIGPAVTSDDTDGIELLAAEQQTITVQRGNENKQTITLDPLGITVDAGPMGFLTIKAGGSSISLGPEGITICGKMVNINPPMGDFEMKPPAGPGSTWG